MMDEVKILLNSRAHYRTCFQFWFRKVLPWKGCGAFTNYLRVRGFTMFQMPFSHSRIYGVAAEFLDGIRQEISGFENGFADRVRFTFLSRSCKCQNIRRTRASFHRVCMELFSIFSKRLLSASWVLLKCISRLSVTLNYSAIWWKRFAKVARVELIAHAVLSSQRSLKGMDCGLK